MRSTSRFDAGCRIAGPIIAVAIIGAIGWAIATHKPGPPSETAQQWYDRRTEEMRVEIVKSGQRCDQIIRREMTIRHKSGATDFILLCAQGKRQASITVTEAAPTPTPTQLRQMFHGY